MFSPEIAEKPYVVAFNKMDLPEAYEKWPSFKEKLQARGIEPFCMSAVKREGTHEVISTAYQLLQKNKEAKRDLEGQTIIHLNYLYFMLLYVWMHCILCIFIYANPSYVRHL